MRKLRAGSDYKHRAEVPHLKKLVYISEIVGFRRFMCMT